MKISELNAIRDKVHLNPSWQRGPVWSTPKKALLVDSILRKYDVPMIYFRECTSGTPFKYEVVDGQQRLRSIWDFRDGELVLSEDFENVGKHKISNKKYRELHSTLKRRFNSFQLVIAFVKRAREPVVSKLFSRMQMGVRLNPAELRNAVQTGLRHAIDSTARLQPFFQKARIPSARFKHQDYLAHAVSICMHGVKRDLKAPNLMDDYKRVLDDTIYAPIISDSFDILEFLNRVNRQTAYRITQKWIFVDLFYLLFQKKKKLRKLSYKKFAEIYLKFDKERLKHNAVPEILLQGKPNQNKKDLYNYINAFKISGGTSKNLKRRNNILKRRFKSELGD